MIETPPTVDQPFVILGHGRSGSTTFRGLLSQHPNIHAYGELFRTGGGQAAPLANGRRFAAGDDPVAFLRDSVFLAPNEFGKGCVGFKLFFHHAREDASSHRLWPYLLARQDLKVILLFRRNLFDSYVSVQRAKRSGQFGYAKEAGPSAAHRAPFKVDIADCLDYMTRLSVAKARLREMFAAQPHLSLDYETLFQAPQDTMAQVFAFLGEDPIDVGIKDRKLNRVPHSEGITNYRAVADFFRLSLFEDYFDAPPSLADPAAASRPSAYNRGRRALYRRWIKLRAAWMNG